MKTNFLTAGCLERDSSVGTWATFSHFTVFSDFFLNISVEIYLRILEKTHVDWENVFEDMLSAEIDCEEFEWKSWSFLHN